MRKTTTLSFLAMVYLLSSIQAQTTTKQLVSVQANYYGNGFTFWPGDSTQYIYLKSKRKSDLKNNVIKYDTSYLYTFDQATGAASTVKRSYQTFDNKDNVISIVYQNLKAGLWEDSSRFTYTYNSNNKIVEHIKQGKAMGKWNNSIKETWKYHPTTDTMKRQYWDGGSGTWDVSIDNWYYHTGNRIDSVLEWGGTPPIRTYYFYSNNRLDSVQRGIIGLATKTIVKYDPATKTDTLLSLEHKRYWRVYDNDNDIISSKSQNWLKGISIFYWDYYTTGYDPDGIYHLADTQKIYHYEMVPDYVDEIKSAKAIKIYPSPASHQVIVDINNYKSLYISISDLNGKIVRTSNKSSIMIDDLNNGFYFINVYADGEVYSEKILISH